jgi:hypothetical protein
MEHWGLGRRIGMGVIWAIGLGWLGGSIEMVALAASEKLSLSWVGFFLLGVVCSLAMGVVAALFGLLTSPAPFLLRNTRPSTGAAIHLALAGLLLCGFYLWQGAWTVYTDGRGAVGALAMAAMPLGFAGVIYFNARFFLRRMEIEKPLPIPWLPVAGAGALVLVGLSATFYSLRDTGGAFSLPDDKNVVFVTVDGWAAPDDALPIPGTGTFTNAVTPAADTRAAAATVLTGLHPLRHRVLDSSIPLDWAYPTIPELLATEAYATGAFVSTRSVDADSGLEQGFLVFDDDFSPVVSGLFRLSILKPLAARVSPGRSGDATIDRFEAWLAGKAEHAFFAWVHLPATDAAETTAQLTRITDLLDTHGVADETLFAAVGTWASTEPGLFDPSVSVPLVLRVPGVEPVQSAFPQQVRTMDLAGTAAAFLVPLDTYESEGVDLARHLQGVSSATISCTLVGPSPDGSGWRIGMRNNGVKYLVDRATDAEHLFHVERDPTESTDIQQSQPETLEAARRMLGPERVALDKILR